VVNWQETAVGEGGEAPSFVNLGALLGRDWSGTEPSQEATQAHGGRLGWIYYYRGSEDPTKRERREARLFAKPELVYASRFFCCHRLDIDRLPADHPLRDRINRFPAFDIQGIDGTTALAFAGAASSDILLKKLSEAFRAQYGEDLGKRVRRHVKVMDGIERLDATIMDVRAFIRDLEYDLEERSSHADARELARARKSLEKAEKKRDELRGELRSLEALPVVAKMR
jgi:hypothetical protein